MSSSKTLVQSLGWKLPHHFFVFFCPSCLVLPIISLHEQQQKAGRLVCVHWELDSGLLIFPHRPQCKNKRLHNGGQDDLRRGITLLKNPSIWDLRPGLFIFFIKKLIYIPRMTPCVLSLIFLIGWCVLGHHVNHISPIVINGLPSELNSGFCPNWLFDWSSPAAFLVRLHVLRELLRPKGASAQTDKPANITK